MAIVKMKKIRLFAVRDQKEQLLADLQRLGCVEFSEQTALAGQAELASILKKESGGLDKLRSDLSVLSRALELLDHYAPQKTKMFEQRPEISEETLLNEAALSGLLTLCADIEHKDAQLKRLAALETQHNSLLESLDPWRDLEINFDFSGTAATSIVFGTLPVAVEIDNAEHLLGLAVPEAQLLPVSSHHELHYVVLIALRERMPHALESLRLLGFSNAPLKDLEGTAAENIDRVTQRLDEMAQEKLTISEELTALADCKNELKRAVDLLSVKIAKGEAAEQLLGTERAVVMTGWVPAEAEKALADTLSKYACAWDLSDPTEEETADVPVALKNNKFTAPLMMVTEMYSLPSYVGIDPNPLIMFFFTVFFGIMYADIGYGIILLTLGILATKLLKLRGTMKYAAGLLILCGATTTIFGVLFGSCFGDAIPVFTKMIGIGRVELWNKIDPLKEPMQMLIISLGIGVVHLLFGMGIKAYLLIRDGKPLAALFDVGSWWLLFAGIALGAMGITWWVAIGGAAALILTQGRDKPNIVGKFFGGIASLYDVVNFLADVLSYSRLMALLLASSVIASVVNVLGSLGGSVIGFIIVFLIGHTFNMAINIIGTYVHAARLQYLEFFGKFYEDGGRAFKPLKIKTNYYDIIKEEN